MSSRELERLEVLQRIKERRLSRVKAATLLGITDRQVRRLYAAYETRGAAGLVHGRRGRPSNHRLSVELQEHVVSLVRAKYPDFGPTLAREKLLELHDLRVSRETLRKWLVAAGIWKTRAVRRGIPHQPRNRRECFGELVQIDGCEHHWFEDRAPPCTLLVYVDDATSRLMELHFVETESAFDYFTATRKYLERHGKPVAFYSDKHSIFRVQREGATGRNKGISQFGRALAELNIDIICANTPQAKGRVERMHSTLQDRLVKELRLKGLSTMDAANVFAPEFMDDYNRRFGREPKNPHDAHRPLLAKEKVNLSRTFTWQEERTLTSNLVVHYKRATYLVKPTAISLSLRNKRVHLLEHEDGAVEIWHGDNQLPYSIFNKDAIVTQGAIVDNKRLGSALLAARALQAERDAQRLASKQVRLREKERIRAAWDRAQNQPRPGRPRKADKPPPGFAAGMAEVLSFMKSADERFRAKRRDQNQRAREKSTSSASVMRSWLDPSLGPKGCDGCAHSWISFATGSSAKGG